LVPNALGGQAQPAVVSDAGDGAALASPDALASSVDTSNTTYARIYVTDSTSGAINYTSRLGAVPTGADPAEPDGLTNPGSLGYKGPASGTEDSASAEGPPRTDTLFQTTTQPTVSGTYGFSADVNSTWAESHSGARYKDPASGTEDSASAEGPPRTDTSVQTTTQTTVSGIYNYSADVHFTRAESHLGVRAGGDIIIAAGVGKADTGSGGVGKDLDLSAIGDIRLWAGGKVKQYANGDSENYYHGQRYTTVVGTNKTTVHGSSGSTTYGDATSEIHGFQKSYVYGYSLTTMYGLRTTFNFAGTVTSNIGAVMTLNVGASTVINASFRLNLNALGVWNHTTGFNVTTNYGATISTTQGFATGILTGGRSTFVTGIDFKNVTGLDMKIVDMACDVKINEIKLSESELAAITGFTARKQGITMDSAEMKATAITYVTVLI
jgi:hypothetical protein